MSTIYAIYIVTLPNIRPLQALKSSKKLIKGRRLLVLRKLLFLPLILVVGITVISIIVIAIIPQLAEFVFIALSTVSVLIAHSYLYNLYRELI